jgi:hypothetical protein
MTKLYKQIKKAEKEVTAKKYKEYILSAKFFRKIEISLW